jgi:hypothetical protein
MDNCMSRRGWPAELTCARTNEGLSVVIFILLASMVFLSTGTWAASAVIRVAPKLTWRDACAGVNIMKIGKRQRTRVSPALTLRIQTHTREYSLVH